VWVVAELIGWHPIARAGAGTRPVGPFGSSAYLGAAAVLLGPIAVAATAGSRRIAIPTGALAAVALIASGARAAWVGALVAGAAWLVVRGAPKRLGALLGAVAIAAVFAFGVAGRVPDLISDRDGGARGRLDEWRVATRVIEQRPLLGVGPEGYRIAFGRQVDTAYEQRHGRDPLPDRAHSAILDVVATTGVLGALVYVALLGLVGRGAIRALRSGSTLYAAMAIGLIGYIAQSLFLFPIAELDPLAWLFAGILVAATVDLTSVRISRVVRPVAAVLAVVALVAGVLDVVADRQAKRAVAALADEQLPRGDGPRRLRPDVLSYHLLEARAGEARGTPSGFRDALTAVDRALRISHRDPVARMEQGRLQLEQARVTGEPRDMARAVATLKRLVAGDPHNAAAWLRLGVASAVAGDDRGAESAWKQAARLAPRSAAAPVDLALAYVRQQRWAEARTEAARAIARDPGNPEATEVLRQANGTDRTR
jgi:tetratricopeptide (TPR) repeat protein